MRDFTNLQWPEEPFGADQRPFGRRQDMLAAFTFDWALVDDHKLPVSASVVYLRVRKRGTALQVDDDTLAIGFRTTVIESTDDLPDVIAQVDRAFTRARRHAAILTGHSFDPDLTRLIQLSQEPARGLCGVLEEWRYRHQQSTSSRELRGLALMIDTQDEEVRDVGAALDLPLVAAQTTLPDTPAASADRARALLSRCLAVGLTAAVHAGRLSWEDTFRVGLAVEREAWDVLGADPGPGATAAVQVAPEVAPAAV